MPDSYLVRGALIICNNGSHYRRLDLPAGHGSFVRKKPMMTATDTKPNDNIPCFGVCRSANNPNSTIVEITDITNAIPVIDGRGKAKPPRTPITGKPCTPDPIEKWLNPKEQTLINGVAAITMESLLICKNGGEITPLSDGQEVSR